MGALFSSVRCARRFRVRAAAAMALSLAVAFSGCAIPTWKYKPALSGGQVGERPRIQVAIERFVEGREQIELSNGKIFLSYIPLLPYVDNEMQMTDEGQKQWAQKMNAPPQPEFLTLAGRALYDELRAAKAFGIVDYDPSYSDDYDLTFKGRLTSTRTAFRFTSFGLGMAGVILWLFPFPFSRLQQFYEYELTVTDAGGKEIAKASAGSDFKWWASLYYGIEPKKAYEVFQKVMQEANAKMLAELLPKIDAALGEDLDAVAAERRLRYYRKLDPGLARFADVMSGEREVMPEKFVDYVVAYDLKLALLEGLRLVEREFAEQEQEARTRAFNEEMENIAAAQRLHMQQAMQQAASTMASAAGSMSAMNNVGSMNDFQAAMTAANELNRVGNTMQQMDAQQARLSQESEQRYNAMLQTQFEKFQSISGTRAEVRTQWLERYDDETPRYEEIARGKWSAEYGFDVPASAPVAATPTVELKEGEGGVLVTSTPAGADLHINGEFFGMTPSALAFPMGTEIKLEVRREGYAPFERTLKLQTPNVLRIDASLQPMGEGAAGAPPPVVQPAPLTVPPAQP